MNANDIQIGGDHYRKAGNDQHWDMLAHCGYGWEYYVGRATAYFSRIKDIQLDPGKGGHFIDKLVELVDAGRVPNEFQTTQGLRINCDAGRNGRIDVVHYLDGVYFPANGIDPASDRAEVIRILMCARTKDELILARERARLVEAAAANAPTAGSPAGDATASYANQDDSAEDTTFRDGAGV